jgi:hypothetical protein
LTKAAPDIAPLPAAAVEALAIVEGYPPLDADTAARIAIGASNATRAVTESVTESLFDTEPGSYAAELERLADTD